jgi:uncharacterized membrane protein
MAYLSVGIFFLVAFAAWAFYRLGVKKDQSRRDIYLGFLLVVVVLVVLYFLLPALT